MVVCGRHNTKWQGQSNAMARGVENSANWLQEQLHGGFMNVMNDIAGVLTSQEDCEEVGFTIPPPTAKAQSYEHGEVTFDDSFALLYFKYVFGLISNRVVGEFWWLTGWPHSLPFWRGHRGSKKTSCLVQECMG